MAQHPSILERFDGAVRDYPDHCAVEGARYSLSYRQLDLASRLLAARLLESGVAPRSFVPLLMSRSPEYVVCVLAILRCGAVYTPIDPESPAHRRDSMLRPLNARVCLSDGTVEPPSHLRIIDPHPILREALDHPNNEKPAMRFPDDSAASDPDAAAYVMYTSGSTGEPKGVVVPHRAVIRLVVDTDYTEFGPDQRWALHSAIAFDASTLELWGPLLNGGCCVVQEKPLPSLDEIGRFLSERRITDVFLTTALFNALVEDQCGNLRGLSRLFTGGERASALHMRRFRSTCPEVRLVHCYGPTENTTFSLCHTLREEDVEGHSVPMGRAIRGSTARIVAPGSNPDQPEPPITEGELLVGGDGLAVGYFGRPDLSAERFVHDSAGERWYRTGDKVRQDAEGLIEYIGRIDRQVKIRGHRIELDEVESILAGCPGVRQSALSVVGEDAASQRIVAAYAAEDDVSADDLIAFLGSRLPQSMIPNRFVRLDSLPRGLTGKIDRGALAEACAPDSAVEENKEPSPKLDGPSPTLDRLIGLVIARLPGASERDLAHDTDLFSIGGHSLLAMRLAVDIERELGSRIDPVDILKLRRLGPIAKRIEELRDTEPPEPMEDAEPLEMGNTQFRFVLENERDPTGRALLVHQGWMLDPGKDSAEVREAWVRIARRHEILRTGYSLGQTGFRSTLLDLDRKSWFRDEGDLPFGSKEVRIELPTGVKNSIGERIRAGEMPMRVHLWRLSDQRNLVVAAYHHAAVDEWALDLIEEDFLAALSGEGLTEIPPQYSLYIACEHRWQDERYAANLAEEIARTGPGRLELPRSGPQPGRFHEFELPPESGLRFAESIDRLAGANGVTPASAMLALYGEVLQEAFGDPGRWVMTPVSKRIDAELQNLVGCCLDMRIVDTASDPGRAQLDRYAAVQAQLQTAQGRSTLPLDTLVDRLRGLSADAAEHATRFGFTYRVFDREERTAAGHTLTRLQMPQLAARFALALHIERYRDRTRAWFEASQAAFTADALASLADRVLRGLTDEAGKDRPLVLPSTAEVRSERATLNGADHSKAQSPRARELLSELWIELLGTDPRADPDFYRCGGNSLLAMKLAGLVHSRMGRKLHIGEFLRYGTFDAMLEWVRDDPEAPYTDFRANKERSGGGLVLAFPGASGRALDLNALWTAYESLDPDISRMIGFDLVTISDSLDMNADVPSQVIDRAVEVCSRERRGEPVTLLGYSLGGLIAIGTATRLIADGVPVSRLILVDTYAPPYMNKTIRYYAARLNAEIRRGRSRGGSARRTGRRRSDRDAALTTNPDLWKQIIRAFVGWDPPKVSVPTLLIRSASGAQRIRPLLHRSTNGLGPSLGGPIRSATIDVDHLAMLTTGSESVAEAISRLTADPI